MSSEATVIADYKKKLLDTICDLLFPDTDLDDIATENDALEFLTTASKSIDDQPTRRGRPRKSIDDNPSKRTLDRRYEDLDQKVKEAVGMFCIWILLS